jgi:pimeloyl-ACP methyl ester carboxylesterase
MEYYRHYLGPLSYICSFARTPSIADTILFCIPTRHMAAISFLPFMTALSESYLTVAVDLPSGSVYNARQVGVLLSYLISQFDCRKILVGHGTGGNLLTWVSGYPTILINCATRYNEWAAEKCLTSFGELKEFDHAYGLAPSPLRVCLNVEAVTRSSRVYDHLFERGIALRPILVITGSQDYIVDKKYEKTGVVPVVLCAGHMSIVSHAEQIACEIRRVL